MSNTATDLDRLKFELGEQQHLLQYVPFHELAIETLDDDPAAVSFKIQFGYIRVSATNVVGSTSSHSPEEDMAVGNLRKIWIHFYPAVKPGKVPEIQFHAYGIDGGHIARHDGENIGRTVSGCVTAFLLPGQRTWSRAKLMALAKYYFLRKLAETSDLKDIEKLQHGVPITKSFKEELKAVCRKFKENADKKHVLSSCQAATHTEQTGSTESCTSDAPTSCVEKGNMIHANAAVFEANAVDLTKEVAEVSCNITASHGNAKEKLTELYHEEEVIVGDIIKIAQEISALRTKYKSKEEEHKQLLKRKEEMLQGISSEAAFSLGIELGRDRAKKRTRVSE